MTWQMTQNGHLQCCNGSQWQYITKWQMSKFWVAGEQLVTQKGHLESNNAGGLMSGVGLD